jgi:hypothetical protein
MYTIFWCALKNNTSSGSEENGKIFAMDASKGRKVL